MDGEQYKTDTFLNKIKKFFIGKSNTTRTKPSCAIVTISVILIWSLIGFCVMWCTDIYLSSILEQMTITEGSDIFKAWSSPPVKPLICAHVFNYTNVERFTKGLDLKLKLEEVGPYCYRETLKKTNIKFNNNGTVTYSDKRTHIFEPNKSKGNLEDLIVVPNIPVLLATAKIKNSNWFDIYFRLLNYVFGKLEASIKVKAHDYLFGYDDPLFATYKGISEYFYRPVPINKFGVLAMRGAETNDSITVKTGSNDLDHINIVTRVNGMSSLDAWDNDTCNMIDGSDGGFFPRHLLNRTNTLYLFHKDMCRKVPLVYQKDVEFQDGVMAMRFHLPANGYDTKGTCYCKGSCPPKGVFDISPCAEGAPFLMSFPHFMNAEPKVTEFLEGLEPDPKKHDFYIDIQPMLGFTLGTVTRIQINIQVKKADNDAILPEFKNNMILPILWLEVTADSLPEDLYNLIYHSSVTVKVVQQCLKWFTLAASVLSSVCLIYFILRKAKEEKIKQTEIENNKMSPSSAKIIITNLTSV